MKPAPFAYHRPETLEEALELLARFGGDAKPLAGGQSLVPAMNFRLAQPSVLVDLNRIGALAGVAAVDDGLRIGAMTRHRVLEQSPLVARLAPLIAETMPFVAHPPIRTRGTLGGSLAHADPAAELPAVMLALGATISVRSHVAARAIPASAFFVGLFATSLAPGELVVDVTIPAMAPGSGWAVDEVSRRHGDFALAGAAAVVTLDPRGHVATATLALLSLHDRAVRAIEGERVITGERPDEAVIRAAADAVSRLDVDPATDVHASSAYRRHLAGVMVRRVLTRAVERATPAR